MRPRRRFVLLLARTWFHCRPDEVAAQLSAPELAELYAEYRLSPWDEGRRDFMLGKVCAEVANASPWRRRGSQPATAEQFQAVKPRRKRRSVQELSAKLDAIFGAAAKGKSHER